MIGKLLNAFGDSNEKQVKRYRGLVDAVGRLEDEMTALPDGALAAKTVEFRERIANGETPDGLLPEAFAVVREAARRTIGLRHFDVQLIGGKVLHEGKVAEMKTGEGKTLVATLPVYLNALSGEGVHVVTVNDYLARRDAAWMGKVYKFLGLSVGCLQHESSFLYEPGTEPRPGAPPDMRPVPRKDAYRADVTYGTNNEFGFDYLRHNLATASDERIMRISSDQIQMSYAIVDEVDNILIDEARTPLIISGPSQESLDKYGEVAGVVPRLQQDADFTILEKERQALLTDAGITKVERALNVRNLYDPDNSELTHYVENALRAQFIYQRDKDYVVRGGEVVLVDEFTGRLMEGRRLGEGLHQAIEAKEGVKVQPEMMTFATVTLQNFFLGYKKLAGMTGTALTEAEEFYKVYDKLDVVPVPTNQPMIRIDHPDFVYKTHAAKFKAVVDQIAELQEEGRPVLVGTASIERSEQLSGLLRKRGVKHEVLNAKNHAREAQIIADAGKPGAVTVSTNMAGRGTDIILGGDPSARDPEEWSRAHEEVVAKGGLCVVGTERHESRRIDNQLRGRSGRQGDPGETRFYVSLEDELLTRFSGGMMGRLVGKALEDDVPLESGMLTKSLEMTQGKAESYYFDIRKHLKEYDDVVNAQRKVVYAERDRALGDADLKANIQVMIGKEISALVRGYLVGESEDWEIEPLLAEAGVIVPLPSGFDADAILREGADWAEETLLAEAESLYERREGEFGAEKIRAVERMLMLQTIDWLWVRHLTIMSDLRQGIGLYAYGQRDPLVMYKKEGYEKFGALLEDVRRNIARFMPTLLPHAGRPLMETRICIAWMHRLLRHADLTDLTLEGVQRNTDHLLAEIDRQIKIGRQIDSGAGGALTRASGRANGHASAAAPPDLPPDAPRWMRRQAERAAGGGKKARKRKGA